MKKLTFILILLFCFVLPLQAQFVFPQLGKSAEKQDEAQKLFNSARQYINERKYKEAAEALEQAIKIKPECCRLY